MKNKRTGVSLVLVTVLSLLALAIAATPAGAQIPTATVSIDHITLPQGATATLPIIITGAPHNLSGARMNLTYDPAVVQVTAVGGSSFDAFYYNIVDGKVRMIGYQTGASSVTAPATFAEVTVQAIGNPGDYTPLNLENAEVFYGTGSPYLVETNNGSVSIVAAVPVYNTFGMIALIGLLAILLLVKVRKR